MIKHPRVNLEGVFQFKGVTTEYYKIASFDSFNNCYRVYKVGEDPNTGYVFDARDVERRMVEIKEGLPKVLYG